MAKTKRGVKESLDLSLDEYLANPENFTKEQWDRIEKRKALCGVEMSSETAKESYVATKSQPVVKKGKLSKNKTKWIPMR